MSCTFRFRRAVRLFAVLVTAAAVGQAQAGVIISEILYQSVGADSGREWIEIYNNGSSSVDIGGWYIEDGPDGAGVGDSGYDGQTAPISGGTMLGAGGVFVIASTATTTDLSDIFTPEWGPGIATQITNTILLNGTNSGTGDGVGIYGISNSPSATNEILHLRNAAGVLQDAVNYDDAAPWPLDSPSSGSIYVLPQYLTAAGNDDGSHWANSVAGIDGAYTSTPPAPNDGAPNAGSPGVVVSIPEPTSLALIGLAGLLLAAGKRRVA